MSAMKALVTNMLNATTLMDLMNVLARKGIRTLKINKKNIEASLARNPILVTALNPVIGYKKAAAIAKQAYAQGRAIIDVALEQTNLSEAKLKKLFEN